MFESLKEKLEKLKNNVQGKVSDLKSGSENIKNTISTKINDYKESAKDKSPALPSAISSSYTPYNSTTQGKDKQNTLNKLFKELYGFDPFEYSRKDEYNEAIDKILNREQFSYDLNSDALYQQYAEQYTNLGRLAMEDTIGQASALTGGYGNSYATTAGNQAYQAYLGQLNQIIPDLYQLALNKYAMEGEQLNDSLTALNNLYNIESGEYDREYEQILQKLTAANSDFYDSANLYSTEQSYINSLKQQNYENELGIYDRENSNYWNEKNQENQDFWNEISTVLNLYGIETDAIKYEIESLISTYGIESEEFWKNLTYVLDKHKTETEFGELSSEDEAIISDATSSSSSGSSSLSAIEQFEKEVEAGYSSSNFMGLPYIAYLQMKIDDSDLTKSEKQELYDKYGLNVSSSNSAEKEKDNAKLTSADLEEFDKTLTKKRSDFDNEASYLQYVMQEINASDLGFMQRMELMEIYGIFKGPNSSSSSSGSNSSGIGSGAGGINEGDSSNDSSIEEGKELVFWKDARAVYDNLKSSRGDTQAAQDMAQMIYDTFGDSLNPWWGWAAITKYGLDSAVVGAYERISDNKTVSNADIDHRNYIATGMNPNLQKTIEENRALNGGESYYSMAYTNARQLITDGKSKAEIKEYIRDLRNNGFITQNEFSDLIGFVDENYDGLKRVDIMRDMWSDPVGWLNENIFDPLKNIFG